MLAPAISKRAVVALSCLAAAAGCAKVAEQAAEAPLAREPATLSEPVTVPAPRADSNAPDALPPGPTPSIADVHPEPAAPSSPAPALEPELPSAETTAAEPEVVVSATPTERPAQEPEREPEPATSAESPLPGGALDLTSLQTRLRKTKAISLRTKLAVKKESEALLEQFRAYHAEHGTATLGELKRSYDSLFRKLHSLLEDADPPLARDIDRSRAEIWAILADPIRFGASAAGA